MIYSFLNLYYGCCQILGSIQIFYWLIVDDNENF